MSDLIQKIKEELAKFEQTKKALVEELRKEFPQILKPLFKKSKKIESVGWAQYTPYFNDGDPCVFNVHTDYLWINGVDLDNDVILWLKKGIYDEITNENLSKHEEFNSGKYGYSWYVGKKVGDEGYFPNPEFDVFEYELVKEFIEKLSSIPKDFYEDLFGDHVQVTVSRDGKIKVEPYEHD